MNKILCQITWTEQDLIDAFSKKHGREPTSEEFSKCMEHFSAKQLEDRSTEFGWDFIHTAVDKDSTAS